MSHIADFFSRKIKRLSQEHGIVIWYDPDKIYLSILAKLKLDHLAFFQYEGSFFDLRHRIEPLMAGDQRPDMLIYIPLARAETQYAMIEAEAAGCYLAPGHETRECNTRLEYVAAQILGGPTEAKLQDIHNHAAKGVLDLDDIERRKELAARDSTMILKTIYNKIDPAEILVDFISLPGKDPEVQQKDAFPEVKRLVNQMLGLDCDKNTIAAYRDELLKLLIINEFLVRARMEKVPTSLQHMPTPDDEQKRQHIARLVDALRQRMPFQQTYQEMARQTERHFSIDAIGLSLQQLSGLETFPCFESTLFKTACQLFLDEQLRECQSLAANRRGLYWGSIEPYNLLWDWLLDAVEFLHMGERISQAVKRDWTIDEYVKAYTDGPDAWYGLDRLFHTLETDYYILESKQPEMADLLERIVVRIRRVYTNCLREQAGTFQQLLMKSHFDSGAQLLQRRVFSTILQPLLDSGKIAFIQVDALRYDMGAMLLDRTQTSFDGQIQPVLAQLPTITEIGMAAALPDADGQSALAAEKSKIGFSIAGRKLFTREHRKAWLQEKVGVAFFETKIEHLYKPTKLIREEIAKAQFIWVTSTEIDSMGENIQATVARQTMEALLDNLRRAVQQLAHLGVRHIVLIADHGHLFGEEVDPGEKIEAPGGETIALHRRVWIGRGGARHDAYIRVREGEIGLAGDLELVFPTGISFFKTAGGNLRFVHGGISPQEMIIPLLRLTVRQKSEPESALDVKLSIDKSKITNNVFLMQATYVGGDMFAPEILPLELLVQSEGKIVGQLFSADLGYDEKKKIVTLPKGKTSSMTVILYEDIQLKSVDIELLHAETHAVLAQVKGLAVELMR